MTIFTEEVSTIKDYLLRVAETKCVKDQIYYSTELFKYIQTKPIFLSVNPSFRRAVINKLMEFENNKILEKNHEILLEIKKTYKFLDNIRYTDNYKLEVNESPVRKIRIVI